SFVAFNSAPSQEGSHSNQSPQTPGPVKIREVKAGRDDRLWLLTGEFQASGVSYLNGTNFVTLSSPEGLPEGIFDILPDTDGSLWLGSVQGAYHYDGKSFIAYTTADGLAQIMVVSLCRTRDGMMWFGTFGAGVTRYDENALTKLT